MAVMIDKPLNEAASKQNSRYWADENPRKLHEKPLPSPKGTVWCAMGKSAVIGPYFLE